MAEMLTVPSPNPYIFPCLYFHNRISRVKWAHGHPAKDYCEARYGHMTKSVQWNVSGQSVISRSCALVCPLLPLCLPFSFLVKQTLQVKHNWHIYPHHIVYFWILRKNKRTNEDSNVVNVQLNYAYLILS